MIQFLSTVFLGSQQGCFVNTLNPKMKNNKYTFLFFFFKIKNKNEKTSRENPRKNINKNPQQTVNNDPVATFRNKWINIPQRN